VLCAQLGALIRAFLRVFYYVFSMQATTPEPSTLKNKIQMRNAKHSQPAVYSSVASLIKICAPFFLKLRFVSPTRNAGVLVGYGFTKLTSKIYRLPSGGP